MIRKFLQRLAALKIALHQCEVSPPLRVGYTAIGAVFVILSFWSIVMPLAESIVASGTISVSAQRRTVAHQEGGTVADLFVQEGDQVEAGQPLLSLERHDVQSELDVLLYQRHAHQARIDRLSAERRQNETIQFSESVLEAAARDPQISQLLEGEKRNFTSRYDAVAAKIALLRDRSKNANEQKKGLTLQLNSIDRQLGIVRDQAANAQQMYIKGFGTKNKAIAFQREVEQLIAQRLQIVSDVNELNGIIEDSKLNEDIHQTEVANDIETNVLATQNEMAELDEKIDATRTRLTNLVIKSSIQGVIVDLRVTSAHAVIKPAEPILDILPLDTNYLVEAHVSPTDIDGIVAGLPVEVRFPSLASMKIPTILGKVSRVSADVFENDDRQRQYYQILVSIDDWAKVSEDIDVIPGMPTEVIVRKKDRSMLQYFFAPITDHLSRAVVG